MSIVGNSTGNAQVQMVLVALVLAAATVATIAYIVIVKPDYLKHTRFGVPFYSSRVIDPVTNQALDLNALADYYVQGNTKGVQTK